MGFQSGLRLPHGHFTRILDVEDASDFTQFFWNLFLPYFRSTGELTSNYLKGKEARISSFLSDNEFEQIDFVRSLIQHMNHYQLGTIDNDLQVQL